MGNVKSEKVISMMVIKTCLFYSWIHQRTNLILNSLWSNFLSKQRRKRKFRLLHSIFIHHPVIETYLYLNSINPISNIILVQFLWNWLYHSFLWRRICIHKPRTSITHLDMGVCVCVYSGYILGCTIIILYHSNQSNNIK